VSHRPLVETLVRVPTLEHDGHEAGSRVGFFAASMYSEESMIGTATRTFSANPTFAPTGVGADRLDGEAVSKHGVVPDLLQLVSRRA
jgi:hypothetical protein